jgi:3',5'-cyclic AMP phosphodiesterase CpdA
MPIHLPPISRRNFLRRSLAASAGVLLAPNLLTPSLLRAKSTDAHVWAMLADTHIAADPARLGRGLNVTDHLKQVCQEILALETAPAGVIVHGDCAISIGAPGDYAQFFKLLKPLRESQLPIHLALGNHDHLKNFLAAAQPTSPSPVAEKYVSTIESERANFFVLDSLHGDPPAKPSNPGYLGEAQRQWLAKQLQEQTDKPAIIVVHHTPSNMRDWKELVALLDPHKQVKAMFYGHRHTWGLDKTPGGVHLVNLLPTSYPSQPGDGARGWTQATFDTDRVHLHVRCINRENKLHDSVHELKWRVA